MDIIQEALRELRYSTSKKVVESSATMVKTNVNISNDDDERDPYPVVADLWDQVYCSLTDGASNSNYSALRAYRLKGTDRYEHEELDTFGSNSECNIITVNSEKTDPAVSVAKAFNLEYKVIPGKSVSIYVPKDAPVDMERIAPSSRRGVKSKIKKWNKTYPGHRFPMPESAEAAVLDRPLSARTGTLSNVLLQYKDRVDTLFDKRSAIEFLDSIRSEVNDKKYLDKVKFDIMRGRVNPTQYFYNIILKGDGDGIIARESLSEDFDSSLPVQALPHDVVYDFIENVPVATATRPPVFFSVGYMKELTSEIPARFRGGRGSGENPVVRILKCSEMTVYTGADYENLQATKDMRKETGRERSGERTGFSFGGDTGIANKIGLSARGEEQLQCYIKKGSQTKTKYFMSIDNEDLREATKEEVAAYLTPAYANTLLNGRGDREEQTGAKIMRLKLSNIYKIGRNGTSVM